ncbi:hypothetical protein BY458DRAFT_493223 [Sporodiniella umbellata]|nr:hypothetical protein BY458DRAFT_493223 [Sporodiniella umbellata]
MLFSVFLSFQENDPGTEKSSRNAILVTIALAKRISWFPGPEVNSQLLSVSIEPSSTSNNNKPLVATGSMVPNVYFTLNRELKHDIFGLLTNNRRQVLRSMVNILFIYTSPDVDTFAITMRLSLRNFKLASWLLMTLRLARIRFSFCVFIYRRSDSLV